MANYSLILDTKFKPFSYQEMLAPVMAATQAHQALESEYGDLATKASVWERMANEQTDPYAYKMYKTYSEDLENMADQLARSGLNPASRRNMLNMRARYSSEILPIETAYKRREELAAEQRKAMLSNPTLFYQRDAASMSLDDFIKNPSLDYGANYSGSLLAQQAGQMAASLKTALTNKGKLKGLGLPFQYERLLQYGYTPDQIERAINNPKEGDPILATIVDQVLESSGMSQWASPEQLKRARAFANQGLYNAIGKPEIQTFVDQYSMNDALNKAKERREAARRKQEQAEAERQRQLRMYRNNTTRLFSQSEVATANKATLDVLDKWKNKGYINSKGQLTNAGWAAIRGQLLYDASGAANARSPYVRARSYIERDKEFLDWAAKQGVKWDAPTKTKGLNAKGQTVETLNDPVLKGYGDMTNYYNRTRQMAANGELVTGVANIKVLRNRVSSSETTQENLTNLITSANSPIYGAGALQANGTIKQGKKFSAEEFRKVVKDNPITHLINSPTGNQQLVELSNGQRFFIPKSVFGESLVDPIHGTGDLDRANAIIRAAQEGSDDAIVYSANASAYLSSILDTANGEDIDYHGSITEEDLYQ